MIAKSEDGMKVKMFEGVFRKTLASGERITLVEFYFEKGASVPLHRHVHEQIGYVVRGGLELVIDGRKYIVQEGENYLIPSNVEHSAIALEESVAVDAFSPPREDYLSKK